MAEMGFGERFGREFAAGLGGTTLGAIEEQKRRRDLLDITKRKAEKEEKAELLQSATAQALDLGGMAGGGGPPGGGGVLAGMGWEGVRKTPGGPLIPAPMEAASGFLTERIPTTQDIEKGRGTTPVDFQSSIGGEQTGQKGENLRLPSPVDVGMFRARAEGGRKALLAEDFSPEKFDLLIKENIIRETDPGVSGVFELNTASPNVRKAIAKRDIEVAEAERQALVSTISSRLAVAASEGNIDQVESLSFQMAMADQKKPGEARLAAARTASAIKNAPAQDRLEMAIMAKTISDLTKDLPLSSAGINGEGQWHVALQTEAGKTGDLRKAQRAALNSFAGRIPQRTKDLAKADDQERPQILEGFRTETSIIIGGADDSDLMEIAPQFGVFYDPASPLESRKELIDAIIKQTVTQPEKTPPWWAFWRGDKTATAEQKRERDFDEVMGKLRQAQPSGRQG